MLPDLANTLNPRSKTPDGPLPFLLLGLTLLSGLVDAFTYLVLGHVFVANMTGNVVLLGFSVGGIGGFSVVASLTALLAFGVGSRVCGRLLRSTGGHRGRELLAFSSAQWVLLALAGVAWMILPGGGPSSPGSLVTVALMALAMGLQSQGARHLKVTNMTTTVLTMTLTGLFADSAVTGTAPQHQGRRVLSVLAMVLGAFLGALLVSHGAAGWILGAALALLAAVAVTAGFTLHSTADWTHDA